MIEPISRATSSNQSTLSERIDLFSKYFSKETEEIILIYTWDIFSFKKEDRQYEPALHAKEVHSFF